MRCITIPQKVAVGIVEGGIVAARAYECKSNPTHPDGEGCKNRTADMRLIACPAGVDERLRNKLGRFGVFGKPCRLYNAIPIGQAKSVRKCGRIIPIAQVSGRSN